MNKFAEFFQNKIIALRSSFSGCREVMKDLNFNPVQPSALICMSEFSYVTEGQFNLILSSRNNKNYMFNSVPLNLLKLCPAVIKPALHYIVSSTPDPLLKLHLQVASSMQQSLQLLRTPI